MIKYHQGKYRPKNPKKYLGDITEVVYRSSWELKFFIWCDKTDSVLGWASEELAIPYISPVDRKIHRYFPDVKIIVKDKNDILTTHLIEIKPKSQTKPPKRPAKQTKKYVLEVFQYGVNEAKWKAAGEFCLDRGWKFVILTEDDLGISKYSSH